MTPSLDPDRSIDAMGPISDAYNCGLRMRREWRERFPRHRELAIPTCIITHMASPATMSLLPYSVPTII